MNFIPVDFRFVTVDLPDELDIIAETYHRNMDTSMQSIVSAEYFKDFIAAGFLGDRVKNYLTPIDALEKGARKLGGNTTDMVKVFREYRRSIIEYVESDMYSALAMTKGTARDRTEVICYMLVTMLTAVFDNNPSMGNSGNAQGDATKMRAFSRDMPSMFKLMASMNKVSGQGQPPQDGGDASGRGTKKNFTTKQLLGELKDRLKDMCEKVYRVGNLFDVVRGVDASLNMALGTASEDSSRPAEDTEVKKIQSLSEVPNQIYEYPEEYQDTMALSKSLRVQGHKKRVKGKVSAAIAYDTSGSVSSQRSMFIKGTVIAYGQRVCKEQGRIDIACFNDHVGSFKEVKDTIGWAKALQFLMDIHSSGGTDIDGAVYALAERIKKEELDHGILITDGTEDMADPRIVADDMWDRIIVICLDSRMPSLKKYASKYFVVNTDAVNTEDFASIFYEIEK